MIMIVTHTALETEDPPWREILNVRSPQTINLNPPFPKG